MEEKIERESADFEKIIKETLGRFKRKVRIVKKGIKNYNKTLKEITKKVKIETIYRISIDELLLFLNKKGKNFNIIEFSEALFYRITLEYTKNSKTKSLEREKWMIEIWGDERLIEKVEVLLWYLIKESIKSKIEFIENEKKNIKILIKSDVITSLLKNIKNKDKTYPMFCEPRSWKNKEDIEGGYLVNKNKKKVINEKSENKIMLESHIIEGINYVQTKKYRINKKIYNEIKELYKENNEEFNYIDELIIKYDTDQENIEFYFPFTGDYRGRIYSSSDVNPTTSKLFRILLRESQEYKITKTVLEYINYAIERAYSKERNKMEPNIDKKKLNKHLTTYKEEMRNAKNPLEYIYYCISMKDIIENEKKETDLLISLDMTGSGFQILAMLTKLDNEEILKELNLLEKEGKEYGSIYEYYTKLFLKSKKECENKKEEIEKWMKVVIMQSVYGLKKWRFKKEINDESLGEELWSFSRKNVFLEIYKVLHIYGKEMLKRMGAIVWSLTSNESLIILKTKKKEKKLIRLTVDKGKRIKRTLKKETEEVNKKKTEESFVPNLVHSIDALIMHKVLKLHALNFSSEVIYPIHDCFVVRLSSADNLRRLIFLSMIEIFERDDILKNIINNYKEKIFSESERKNIIDKLEKGRENKKILTKQYEKINIEKLRNLLIR